MAIQESREAPQESAVTRQPSATAFNLSRAALAGVQPRLRQLLARASRPGVISLAVGLPASDLLPVSRLAACQASALAHPSAWQYALPAPALKQQLVALMASRGVHCAAEQVFLTSGSQQGMDLLARLLVDPGAPVLLEETVYDGILLALGVHAPRLVTVGSEPETGLDVAAVEAALAGGVRPRLLYTIPNGHNPLGVTLSADKRRRLAELARRFTFPVVEDDAYGSLYYGDSPPPPVRASEERWVFYLGSLSKILAPALRVGWLIVPEDLVPRLSALKHGADLDTPSIGQRVAAAFLESGALPEHAAALRDAYRMRRDTMLECLAAALPASVRWNRPASGLFVWVELPRSVDATALLEFAIDCEGVAFTPGDAFAAAGHGNARHCLRLCFSASQPDEIATGVERLAQALDRFAPASF
jgi:2-aminoadipate transaminase